MKLHDYFRSSAAYRARIALNLKGLHYTQVAHHLRRGGQHDPAYLALNPQGLVPALETDDGSLIPQSLALIEYLDEVYPDPPLLPADALGRARVRSLALAIACDIHPLDNLRVLNYLRQPLGHGEDTIATWYCHWIALGFQALERRLAGAPHSSRFCHGDQPTLADICLIPQVANAHRYDCDLTPYPTIRRINDACLQLAPFQAAAPARQPDAE